MFQNYLKIAFRNLIRKKFYSAINIIGLAIGLTCTILIGLFVQNELSFDKHHKKHNNIYRLESHFTIQESDDYFAATAFPLAVALKLENPEVKEFVRFAPMDNNLFEIDGKKFFEDNVFYADSTIFNVFTHKFIKGSQEKALSEPNTMVLTESFANRIFGQENPIGKILSTGYGFGFTITGVIEDVPYNSHFRFEALGSMITLAEFFGHDRYSSLEPNAFWNIGFYSYILLNEGTDIQGVLDRYPQFNEKYIKPVGDQINAKFQLMVQPLADVHLYSDVGYDLPTGNIAYVYIFSIVAIFLLLIGCINYMNMATAHSATRATEVGIRKVVGANRGLLRRQFLIESLVITFLALVLAFIAAELLLPTFNEIADRHLELNISGNALFFLVILGTTILVGIISGGYPAFYLSSFIPVEVLKGKFLKGRGTLRKILVLLQFSISIIMIIGTFMVAKQLNYLRTKDLGFDDENIVVLTIRDTTGVQNLDAFKEELLKHPQILKAGRSSSIPGQGYGIIVQRYETNDGTMAEKGINFVFVDNDYLDVMNMKIIKGRNFDPNLQTDLEESILMNETTAEILGWDYEEAIGKKIHFGADLDGSAVRETKVVGIVKDFHYSSLHNKVDPILILLADTPLRNISLRIKGDNINETLKYMEEKWDEFCPTFPFDFTFLDDSLNEQYIAEQKIGTTFTYFSILCIIIACLGLFGLASFTAEQRTKEIGIRKVMGASVSNIVLILSKEFSIWVILANIIAWPVAFLALKNWLQNFAYSIDILNNFFIFILSGILALIIALITVSFRAIKAANSNPVKALKYE